MQTDAQMTTEATQEQDHNFTLEAIKTSLLLGLAGYSAYNLISGNIANYINERFFWLTYVSVFLFCVLGLVSLYGLIRGHYRRSRSAYGVEHQRITWPMIGLVSVPLMFGLLLPSQPLGADAINGNISTSIGSVDVSGVFSKDPMERNVLDWLRMFSQSSAPASFDGEEAEFIGFIYREPDFPEGYVMVARFTVSCCVADAAAIGLPVYWPEAADIADGEWVRVNGSFQAEVFRDSTMPVLQAVEVEVIEQPRHPYLYM